MGAMQNSNKPITLFYSYARKDKPLRDKLATHLTLLKSQGYIADWSDQDIKPGQERKNEINKKLQTADIILLLVSPNFIATNYCETSEVDVALQRHEAGEAWVIPVLLRPVDWETSSIGKLQALPYNLKPVANWNDRDSACTEISKNIRNLVIDLQNTRNKNNGEDTLLTSDQAASLPQKKRKRDLYKTIAKVGDYTVGEKIQHKIRFMQKNFSFAAANRRSKGFSFPLLFLFGVLELIALPFVIFQWTGNPLAMIAIFAFSFLLFIMGTSSKNNIIVAVITFAYCVAWSILGYFYLSAAYHLHLTFLNTLLISVLLSCLQLVLFHTRSPRRRRLPLFSKILRLKLQMQMIGECIVTQIVRFSAIFRAKLYYEEFLILLTQLSEFFSRRLFVKMCDLPNVLAASDTIWFFRFLADSV